MSKKNQVKRIFDSIAYRYDLLNHLLSFGVDVYWRKRAIKMSGVNSNSVILDVACGTGDFAITSKRISPKNVFGADLSLPMLKLFNKKEVWSIGRVLQMSAEQPPIKDKSLTNITVAFGVRNFYDISQAFSSLNKLLKENGKLTILEFSLPKNPLFLAIYKLYFNQVLPKVGRLISKDKEAYKYLPDSVKEFDEKINLPELLTTAGFKNIIVHHLTFGIVQIVIASR